MPCCASQMLVDDIGDVTITNDGATILKLLEVEHPAAKVWAACTPWPTDCLPWAAHSARVTSKVPHRTEGIALRRSWWSWQSCRTRKWAMAPHLWSLWQQSC